MPPQCAVAWSALISMAAAACPALLSPFPGPAWADLLVRLRTQGECIICKTFPRASITWRFGLEKIRVRRSFTEYKCASHILTFLQYRCKPAVEKEVETVFRTVSTASIILREFSYSGVIHE